MTRVLVTGARGFIGRSALAPLRDLGYEVHAVGRTDCEGPPGVRWHAADLLDGDARRAVVEEVAASHLLHLAWYAEHGKFWASAENVRWVGATGELIQEFAAAGGGRAVVAGTGAEYDWTGGGVLTEGKTPLRPATLYGACKDATRRICEALGRELSVEMAWGRIFFLYGPGEDERRLVASVAKALTDGERARTSAGTQVRDFMYVDDVARAFATLVDSDVTGAVNVASGRPVTVREVVELIARAAGREDLLDIGALPMREGDPAELVPSVMRLREEVGFEPALTLKNGVAATVADLERPPARS